MEKLSITDAEQEINLKESNTDALAASVKVGIKAIGSVADNILGITPIGSIITELITTTIPNRRMENFVLMLEIFGDKVKYFDKDVLELKMKTKEFEDLIQDGALQASRALSRERLEYIASLLKNSLNEEELEHIENKKLLSLLGELNDAEIIWLQSFLPIPFRSDEFIEKHEKVLFIGPLYQDCSKSAEYKQAIQKSYKLKLIQLGLVREIYERYDRDESPKFDEDTGKLKVSHYQISTLGYSLLRITDIHIQEN